MHCFVICARCCRIPGWTTEVRSDWGALETVPQKHLHQMWDTSLPSASSQLRWHEHTGIALQLTKTPAHLHPAGTCFFIADLGSILSWECHILRSISITPPIHFSSFQAVHLFFQVSKSWLKTTKSLANLRSGRGRDMEKGNEFSYGEVLRDFKTKNSQGNTWLKKRHNQSTVLKEKRKWRQKLSMSWESCESGN